MIWTWDYETDYYHIFNDEHTICITAPETDVNDILINEIVERLNRFQYQNEE